MKKAIKMILLISVPSLIIGIALTMWLVLSERDYDIRDEAKAEPAITVCNSGCTVKDINKAFNKATATRNIIQLNTKSYDGSGVLSGTAQLKLKPEVKKLTIKGKDDGSTVWKLSNSIGNGHQLHIENLEGVTVNVKNVTFKDNANENSSVHIYGNNEGCTVNFTSVKVIGSKGAGIYYDGDAGGTVDKSTFTGNEWPGVSVHRSANVTVKNSTFKDHKHQGIDVNNDSITKIQNNIISENATDGISTHSNSSSIIINNTIVKNTDHGIDILDNSSGTIINNISAFNKDGGIRATKKENFEKLEYNLAYGNEGGDWNEFDNWPPETNISKDPKFVSSTDFHLKKDSPAIDAGDPSIKDPDGTRSDMGAYGGPGAELPEVGPSPKPPSPQPPKETKGCSSADIWGPNGKSDKNVNIYDLALVLSKYGTSNPKADIAGNGSNKPDGTVNIFDVVRIVSGCWKAKI